jgi:hypothetical protein
MKSLIEYFNCGNLYKDREYLIFVVRKIYDLTDKIISFFVENPIKGVKSKDFEDFCKAAELIKTKAHLTKEGLVLRTSYKNKRGYEPWKKIGRNSSKEGSEI